MDKNQCKFLINSLNACDSSLYALIVFVLPSVDASVTRTILISASEVNMRGSTFSIL